MDVLNRILMTLESKNIEQKALADAIGVRKQTISDWKSGKTKSYTKYIAQIAEFLGVSVDYLLNGETAVPDPNAGTSFAIPQISKDLAAIMQNYDNLSEDGKKKALEYLQMLREHEQKKDKLC
ncbi:MAG: helix-turn-helix domain-containing protein [Candidatus Ornithomonoglobus sp.]